jgi:hypothetical protein
MPGYIPYAHPTVGHDAENKNVVSNLPDITTFNQDGNITTRRLLPNGECVEMNCYPNCEFPRC